MNARIKRHIPVIKSPLIKSKIKEILYDQKGNFAISKSKLDRISFSVQRNSKGDLRNIENISYEASIGNSWEWIVRYDDHSGKGLLHRHIRSSFDDAGKIETPSIQEKFKSKEDELTWVCKEIKDNFLQFRAQFSTNSGLDLY